MKQDKQDNLREQVRLCKALFPEWNYRSIAEAINISHNSFYNWMNRQYSFCRKTKEELEALLYILTEK